MTHPLLTALCIDQKSFPLVETMWGGLALSPPVDNIVAGDLQKAGGALEFVRHELPVARCYRDFSKLE